MKTESEICCFSLQSALIADKVKANRIELCGGFLEGGTTPSHGLVKVVLGAVNPKVYVMIRPRGGDFIYSETEIQTIYNDIDSIKKLKPAGFVFGALLPNGELDEALCRKVIKWAEPLPVTFHRAFDQCIYPMQTLEKLIQLGFERVLSSGQKDNAFDGLALLKEMQLKAKDKIQIMAGAGINTENVTDFLNADIPAVHFTAKDWQISRMELEPKVGMAAGILPDSAGVFETSIQNAITILKKINAHSKNK